MRKTTLMFIIACAAGTAFSCGGGGFGGMGGSGGSGELMSPAKRIRKPDTDTALVTFVRSSVMAFGVDAMLWDSETLIGELNPRHYIQYKAAPGKHIFLLKGATWSYLNANLVAGKHYVVIAKVDPGGSTATIDLKPALPFEASPSKLEVDEWLLSLGPEHASAEYAEVYKNPYLPALRTAIQKYDDGKVEYLTLNPGDDWPHLALNPPTE